MNKQVLFVASCISLATTSMFFILSGAVVGDLCSTFNITNQQMGLIFGPAFWGVTISIFISGFVLDALGMRLVHLLSSLLYIGGIVLILLAAGAAKLPAPDPNASIFAMRATTMLFFGFLATGIGQGLVQGVVTPLIVTVYSEEKTRKLNILHSFFPGGMVIGGIVALILAKADASWKVKIGSILIPAVIYLLMILTQKYPKTERAASNISTGTMISQAFRPLFLLLAVCFLMTAATELAPDQWFPKVMGTLTGLQGVMFLMYTAGLMFILRFFVGGLVLKTLSPFATLTICSVLAFIGLYWLGGLQTGASVIIAFAAATVFAFGKAYYWPTMLGVTSELFPKGGALLVSLLNGLGFLSISLVLPRMGAIIDASTAAATTPGAAFRFVAVLPVILFVIFGGIYLYFRSKGGYKPVHIDSAH